MHNPTDRIAHTTAFVVPVVEHWVEREIAQWIHPMKDRSDDPSHHERTLLPRSYISLLNAMKEWNVSFNDPLNAFYLRLYHVGHTDRTVHTMMFVAPVDGWRNSSRSTERNRSAHPPWTDALPLSLRPVRDICKTNYGNIRSAIMLIFHRHRPDAI